jgi:DNA repair protein RadC
MNPLSKDFRQAGSCGCREAPVIRPRVLAERRPKLKPVDLTTVKGDICRPAYRIAKDPEPAAACNALANEIGPLNEPKKAFRMIKGIINEPYEVFGVMTMDLHLRYKKMFITGRGESAAVMAPMVPTLHAALTDGAYAVVIFHCHPSGIEAKPSQADKETTKAFVKAFEIVGIVFIDHIITGGDAERPSFYSFAEDGKL